MCLGVADTDHALRPSSEWLWPLPHTVQAFWPASSLSPSPLSLTARIILTPWQPFKAQYPENPSWEIAKRLPHYLPKAKVPTARRRHPRDWPSSLPPSPPASQHHQDSDDSSTCDGGDGDDTGDCAPPGARGNDPAHPPPNARSETPFPAVRLLVPPAAIRVSWQGVRDEVPRLWGLDGATEGAEATAVAAATMKRPIDLAVHIGMAGPNPFYSVERRAHRDGYKLPDVDGRLLCDGAAREHEGEAWVWHDMPEELLTDVDVDDVLARWKSYCDPVGWRPSRLDLFSA